MATLMSPQLSIPSSTRAHVCPATTPPACVPKLHQTVHGLKFGALSVGPQRLGASASHRHRQPRSRSFFHTLCAQASSGPDGPQDVDDKDVEAPHALVSEQNRRQLLLGGLGAVIGATLAGAGNGWMPAALAQSYDYYEPARWGGLCGSGTSQSPIDIPLRSSGVDVSKLGRLQFQYQSSFATFVNTGKGMLVNIPRGTNIMRVGDRTLELEQVEFHVPSEHSFNGSRAAMEAHLMHRDTVTGQVFIVGVMMEHTPTGSANTALDTIISKTPGATQPPSNATGLYECYVSGESHTCSQAQISAASLLPRPDLPDGGRSYVHYQGSLTSPPCTENVDWILLASSIRVPSAQVLDFMSSLGDRHTLTMNARPSQNLNDRVLFVGQ